MPTRLALPTLVLAMAALTASPALAQDDGGGGGGLRRFDVVPRQPGHLGLGIGGGTRTTGVSLKYTPNERFSLQAVAGADSGATNDRGGTLALAGTFLFEMPALFDDPDLEIAWCWGPGPYVAVGEDFWLGGHFVLGLEFNIRAIPLEVQLEYRPSLEIIGPDDVALVPVDFGGHVRWWF